MRVFVAVEMPGEVRARVAAASRVLLAGVRAAKLVAEENLHVTVRFVGEVGSASIEALQAAIRDAASVVETSTARAWGFGAFPNERRPRVVWAGIDDPAKTLASIESSIASRLDGLGYAREARPFSAHVTVARVKEGVRDFGPLPARLVTASFDAPSFGAVPIERVTVFRSDPSGAGPRYTPLARFPLAMN